jgi:hypothetical protein
MYLVECKLTESPDRNDCRGIIKCKKMYGEEALGGAFIACRTKSVFTVYKNIIAKNGWDVWDIEL